MKQKIGKFDAYLSSLPENEQQLILAFFTDFKERLDLFRRDEIKMERDLQRALHYYREESVPLLEALRRLSHENLGGFYARPARLWYKLDDAARIYPLAMRHGQMTVFRLSATLLEPIVPALLQIALTFPIKRFPRFATSLKKGIFWHYLETSKKRYEVLREEGLPCRPLKIGITGAPVFRVLYFASRISVEFFHVLTDGSGGMAFLKSLIATYLKLKGVDITEDPSIKNINDTPQFDEETNDFNLKTESKKGSGFTQKRALQMTGHLSRVRPTQILHLRLNTENLKAVSKHYNVTLNTYMLGIVALAAKHATDARKGDIALQVPVNMRQYYASQTLSNFSLYASIRIPIERIDTLSSALTDITTQMNEKANRDKMSEMMYAASRMNKGLRLIPLFIKSPIAKIVYGFIGENIFTTTISNLGIVQTPEVFKNHVATFDFLLGPPAVNRVATTLATYNNITTLTLTKVTRDPSFEESIVRLLRKDNLAVTIEGSIVYGR